MAHLFKDVETFQKVMNMLTITTLPRCALNVIIRVLLAIRIIANQVIVLFSRCLQNVSRASLLQKHEETPACFSKNSNKNLT